MAVLILFLVIIGLLSSAFMFYGLASGVAGFVMFFGLVLGLVFFAALIAGVMTLSMPAAKPPRDRPQHP